MRLSRFFIICVFALVGWSAQSDEATPAWQVGFAQAVITPDTPVMMGGYADRNTPSEGVVNDLHVKALALRDAEGRRVVLITADFLGFRAEVAGTTGTSVTLYLRT